MEFVLKTNSGQLFPNKKLENENSPTSTGKINVDGKLYRISGWTKITKNGGKMLSLAVRPLDEAAQVDRETGEGQANDPGF
jgi:hypothetical protein